ncbi:MAG: hypothetical protein QUS14_15285 [Pyrinomonadaceae bacterium]|nr:hypothetical protein [Pyrinomonadaceae bacterium]
MPEVFKCAACSAPLEFEGKQMQKCSFCGSTVVVPSGMFGIGGPSPFGDINALTGKALKIAEITRLIADGKKIEAIKEFRETFGVGLAEAKNAVDALERGDGVDISGMQIRSSAPVSVTASRSNEPSPAGVVLRTIAILSVLGLLIGGVVVAGTYFFLNSKSTQIVMTEPSSPQNIPRAAAAEASDVEEILKFGGEGTGAGRFTDNREVAVDQQGNIYSGDYSGGRIQVFDQAGTFRTQWAVEDGDLLHGLLADRSGNIYVLHNRGVTKYEGLTGKKLAASADDNCNGIAMMLDGRVACTARKNIFIYDANLKKVREFKNAAEAASSTFGFERIAVDGTGVMFMTDRTSKDIFKFSADGKFLTRIPTEVRSSNDVALDPAGNIYITDTSSIHIFSPDGRLLKKVKATQAFGMKFNDAGEMFVASRPYVIKQRISL